MSTSKGRIYILLTVLIIVGYSWVIYNIILGQGSNQIVCPIKMISGYPCPSCGTTRSVISMFKGDIYSAFSINPFGIFMFGLMLIVPFWLLYDFIFRKSTLWTMYNKVESILKNKKIALPLILLVIANWIWNIFKEI